MCTSSKNYQLQEVSAEELMKYRLSAKAGMVVKIGKRLYLAKRPNNHPFIERELKTDLCDTCDSVCKCCSKASDLPLAVQLGIGRTFHDAVQKYARPEKYDFIEEAVEIFNCRGNSLSVVECANYSERKAQYDEEDYFAETI